MWFTNLVETRESIVSVDCEVNVYAKRAVSTVERGSHDISVAGPLLLHQQLGTRSRLSSDRRRVTAPQMRDQVDWGQPRPRPTLQDLIDVLEKAGLGFDGINPH